MRFWVNGLQLCAKLKSKDIQNTLRENKRNFIKLLLFPYSDEGIKTTGSLTDKNTPKSFEKSKSHVAYHHHHHHHRRYRRKKSTKKSDTPRMISKVGSSSFSVSAWVINFFLLLILDFHIQEYNYLAGLLPSMFACLYVHLLWRLQLIYPFQYLPKILRQHPKFRKITTLISPALISPALISPVLIIRHDPKFHH